jgi:hypothetical protein
MSEWSEAMVDQLRALHADGLSAGTIAAEIGGGISRNAVIGKANRLGLVRNPRLPKPKITKQKTSPRPRLYPRPIAQSIASAPVVEALDGGRVLNIPFLKLASQHCRTVTGSAGFGRSLHCGRPVPPPERKKLAGMFCRECRTKFYQPARVA